VADQETGTDLRLERADLLTEGWRGQVQSSGGAAEMGFLGDGDE
jgi:hypothetical protein